MYGLWVQSPSTRKKRKSKGREGKERGREEERKEKKEKVFTWLTVLEVGSTTAWCSIITWLVRQQACSSNSGLSAFSPGAPELGSFPFQEDYRLVSVLVARTRLSGPAPTSALFLRVWGRVSFSLRSRFLESVISCSALCNLLLPQSYWSLAPSAPHSQAVP